MSELANDIHRMVEKYIQLEEKLKKTEEALREKDKFIKEVQENNAKWLRESMEVHDAIYRAKQVIK